jgi:hypothetical protein
MLPVPAAFSDYLGVEAMRFVTAHPRWRAHQSAVPGPIMGISHVCQWLRWNK